MSSPAHPYHTLRNAIREESDAWRQRIAHSTVHRRGFAAAQPASYFEPVSPTPAPPAAATTKACPWDAEIVKDEAGNSTFIFSRPGALFPAGLPTNLVSGSGMWSTPVSSGLLYIVLHCETNGKTVTSCSLATSGGPPPAIPTQESAPPSSFQIPLYIIISGVPFKIVECANLVATAVDAFQTEKDPGDLTCGGDPHIHYWTWRISSTPD